MNFNVAWKVVTEEDGRMFSYCKCLNRPYPYDRKLGILLQYHIGKLAKPVVKSPIFAFSSLEEALNFNFSHRDQIYNPRLQRLRVVFGLASDHNKELEEISPSIMRFIGNISAWVDAIKWWENHEEYSVTNSGLPEGTVCLDWFYPLKIVGE